MSNKKHFKKSNIIRKTEARKKGPQPIHLSKHSSPERAAQNHELRRKKKGLIPKKGRAARSIRRAKTLWEKRRRAAQTRHATT